MTQPVRHRVREAGNVLFFILMAVALLAALSFAITQGSRDTGNDLSAEKQRLLATEIIDYGDLLQKSTQMLRSRGVTFANLSFAANGLSTAYGAPGAHPTQEIFNDAGGGALYKPGNPDAMDDAAQPYVFTAGNEIAQVGTTCGGADCTELLVLLPGLKKGVCTTLDLLLGVGASGDSPPVVAAFDLTPFAGGAAYAKTVGDDSASAAIAGKSAACVYNTATTMYTFYQVLVAR